MNRRMSNAPVYYVLAQAQFNPVAAMANYINEIQDKLRLEGYTLFEAEKITQLHFDTSSSLSHAKAEILELPIWRITKSNRSTGFILGQSYLAYHTTNYQTHKQFFGELLLGLETIHSIIKLEHLSRLGLRYLNAVLPKKHETVDQYLIDGLHGVHFEAATRYSLSESVFDTNIDLSPFNGTLVNRVYRKTGLLGFPPDMTPNNGLSLMPRFANKENFSHAVIDIDHFIEGQMALNFEQIENQLISLHKCIKDVFKATISPHANKTWA
jgi:uncharacterized protein (TIGR04255 family)